MEGEHHRRGDSDALSDAAFSDVFQGQLKAVDTAGMMDRLLANAAAANKSTASDASKAGVGSGGDSAGQKDVAPEESAISASSSEKRRERRKLRKGGGVDAGEHHCDAPAACNNLEVEGIARPTNPQDEECETTAVGGGGPPSPERKRERRQLRQAQKSASSSSRVSPAAYTTGGTVGSTAMQSDEMNSNDEDNQTLTKTNSIESTGNTRERVRQKLLVRKAHGGDGPPGNNDNNMNPIVCSESSPEKKRREKRQQLLLQRRGSAGEQEQEPQKGDSFAENEDLDESIVSRSSCVTDGINEDNSVTTCDTKESTDTAPNNQGSSSEKRRERRRMRQQMSGKAAKEEEREPNQLPIATVMSAEESEKRRERRKLRQGQQLSHPRGDEDQAAATAMVSAKTADARAARKQKIGERVAKGKIPMPKAYVMPATKSAKVSGALEVREKQQQQQHLQQGKASQPSLSSLRITVGKSSPPRTPTQSAHKTPPSTPIQLPSPSQQERLFLTPTDEVEMKLVEKNGGDKGNGSGKFSLDMPPLESEGSTDRAAAEARRIRRHTVRKGPATKNERVEMALKGSAQTLFNDDHEGDTGVDDVTGKNVSDGDGVGDNEVGEKDQRQQQQSTSFMSQHVKSTLVNVLERDQTERHDAVDAAIARAAEISAVKAREAAEKVRGAEVKHKKKEKASTVALLPSASALTGAVEPETLFRSADEKLVDIFSLVDEERVDGKEANKLFPLDGDPFDTPDQHHGARAAHQAAHDDDADASAWDTANESNISSMLDRTKAKNKAIVSDGGSQPLLDLETNDEEDDGSVKEKLKSQSERLAIYSSPEGFGEGEDSSADNEQSSGDETSVGENDKLSEEVVEYEEMDNLMEDSDGSDCVEAVVETFQMLKDEEDPSKPTKSSRARRWDRNPDAISDIADGDDDESALYGFDTSKSFATTSIATDGSSIAPLGLRFVGSSTVCSGTSSDNPTISQQCQQSQTLPNAPPSPEYKQLDFVNVDADATPKIGSASFLSRKMLGVEEERESQPNLLKIPPPPPEKLRQWEESQTKPGSVGKSLTSVQRSPLQNNAKELSATDEGSSPPTTKPTYKINTPKSPPKKNPHSHSLIDEFDNRMAKKIAIASSNAARKFEEKYAEQHGLSQISSAKETQRKQLHKKEHARSTSDSLLGSPEKSVSSAKSNESTFFCSGEEAVAPLIANTASAGPAESRSKATVGLVRGAFSPWKIPDRADDGSCTHGSHASVSNDQKMDEFLDKAVAATENVNESFEVSLEEKQEAGELTQVLQWLFSEVLPSNSPIAAAFSAFDIHTSTAVQANRVLAIVQDDESFNTICSHVAASVMKKNGPEMSHDIPLEETTNEVPGQIEGDRITDNVSVSTFNGSTVSESFAKKAAERILKAKRQGSTSIVPFEIPLAKDDNSVSANPRPAADVLAVNFVSFLQEIASVSGIDVPDMVHNLPTNNDKESLRNKDRGPKMVQDLIFPNEQHIVTIFQFFIKASSFEGSSLGVVISGREDTISHDQKVMEMIGDSAPLSTPISSKNAAGFIVNEHSATIRKSNRQRKPTNLNTIFPDESPSPFETAVWLEPSIVLSILSCLGDPVAVCTLKRLNVFCNRVVNENQHELMRDAVRLGGMSKFVRPSFWLWITEARCKVRDPIPLVARRGFDQRSVSTAPPGTPKYQGRNFVKLTEMGGKGKWQNIIERDVKRSFGNMPPHKTGARYRQDSIVSALVNFGKEELQRKSSSYQAMDKLDKLPEDSEAKHFKLSSRLDNRDDSSHSSGSLTPTDTVSDWGGISPVGSFVSEDPSVGGNTNADQADISMRMISYEASELLETSLGGHSAKPQKSNVSHHTTQSEVSDPALSGNALTSEMKVDLQNKLRSILHALAARHETVGYCQGMDYVVAHLLRVLQDTILLRAVQQSVSAISVSTKQPLSNGNQDEEDWRTISNEELRARMSVVNSQSIVVEEVVFNVMDTFFSTYNLQHMYWPELRCLKTCCRVFEKLIKEKLPVLADHFAHYDINVGLFALGWFQTLFLYLPSMPSTTVCQMWDIWLVERSFKIFFRVGTAILFLSQPTLLNHDDDGMMTYLNTFPDATLMRRDILIPCALQIKITNRMLVEIEKEVLIEANELDC